MPNNPTPSIGAMIAGAMRPRPAVSGDPNAPGGVTGGQSPQDWRNLYAFSTHGGTTPSMTPDQQAFWKHWSDLGQLQNAQANRLPYVYDPFEASAQPGVPSSTPYFAPGATPNRADVASQMIAQPIRPVNNAGAGSTNLAALLGLASSNPGLFLLMMQRLTGTEPPSGTLPPTGRGT